MLYTNNHNSVSLVDTDYTTVPAYFTEGDINFQSLGIMATAECKSISNDILKTLGISELNYLEETGSSNVIYESGTISGIFEKIKMFFRKIVEKIKKIIHTFMAKMSSVFANNSSFAKKYEKEVIKKWANVSNDWSISGYKYTHLDISESKALGEIDKNTWAELTGKNLLLADFICLTPSILESVSKRDNAKNVVEDTIAAARDKKEDIQGYLRRFLLSEIAGTPFNLSQGGLDSSDFTEECFKVYRNNETDKDDLEKKDINITIVVNDVKDSAKVKKSIEKANNKFTKGVDAAIKNIDSIQKDFYSGYKNASDTEDKELMASLVQLITVSQGFLEDQKTYGVQLFSSALEAIKERTTFYKSIMVKVIGQSKKMTEESYDYSSQYSYDSGSSFMDSVQLV